MLYHDLLASLGYQLTNPDGANADAAGDAPATVVYFAPGFELEAAQVVIAIGAPDTVVPAELPTTPPGPIAEENVPPEVEWHGLYGLESVIAGERFVEADADRWRPVIDEVVDAARTAGPSGLDIEHKGRGSLAVCRRK